MKYLFLVLVCNAVKCEDVGNNYFVVKMPEDIQKDVKDFKKPFHVYWNVPTMQCTSKKIPFQNLYEKFGIIQNDNDHFIGNKIVVIYNETNFPAIINNKTTGKNVMRNGGVPQEGDLENHLFLFEQNLNIKIPDPYFDGIAVIDFESWRPVFRQNFGSLLPHRSLSMEIEKRLHNWWPKMWIEREASLRFETAARRFMLATLSMAKELRPNALWGYYGFPYCFNMRGRDMAEKCAANIDKENDSLYWLWAESTALFPSIYSSVSLSSSQLSSLIKGRMKEASRVRGLNTPIFPYFWFRYRDAGFISEKDLEVALTTLYQSKASGFIIWGSSNDMNTVDKCKKLLKYVETVLGPNIAKFTKPMKKIHNDYLENEEMHTMETSTVNEGLYYSQSTQSLNTDKLFSTETDYNKFTKADESSQTLNSEEISSTESSITYNDYTNNDDSQTLHDFDLTLSSMRSSIIQNEYTNTSQSTQTVNNDEISSTETATAYNKHTNNDENSQSLNNDDFVSLKTSKSYSTYSNTDQSTPTQNYEENSFKNKSNSYSNSEDERLQTSNIDISDKSTPNLYNEYSDSEKNVEPLIIADLIYLSESSAIDFEYNDHSTTSLKNDEISLPTTSTTDNIYRDKSSQSLDVSNEETTIAYNEYSEFEENEQTLHKDDVMFSSKSPIIYDQNRDYITTTFNYDEAYLSRISTISNSHRDHSSKTFNDRVTNEDTSISALDSSSTYNENGDYITSNLNNNEMSLSKITNIDNSYSEESSQTSNNHVSNEENTIVYNEYSKTDDNLHTLNNNLGLYSTISDENRDHSTLFFKNDKMSSTNSVTFYSKYINTDQNKETTNDKEIPSKETSTIYNHILNGDENTESLNNINYSKETSSPSDDGSYTDKSTDILNESETIPEVNEFESTRNVFFNNNILPDFNEDLLDYLTEVDNSTNIETQKVFECQNSTNADDDYLIIVRNEKNKQNLGENMTNSEIETVYYTKQADTNHETVTKNEHFNEAVNDGSYTDKSTDILNESETIPEVNEFESTRNVFFNNNILPDFNEDLSDYLTEVDNSTNIETQKVFECQNSTNADDDYLIIVRNEKNKQNLGENMTNSEIETVYYTKQRDTNHETVTKNYHFNEAVNNLDLIVTYIDKEIGIKSNEKLTTKVESIHSINISNSAEDDGDKFDNLITVDNSINIESYNKSENTNLTNFDNDYLIIVPDFNNKNNSKDNILDYNLDTTTQEKDDFETDTKFEDFGRTVEYFDLDEVYINKTMDYNIFQDSISTGDESFKNNKFPNSDEDPSNYLIKLVTNKEDEKRYEYRESTIADDDYIIIIKNPDE